MKIEKEYSNALQIIDEITQEATLARILLRQALWIHQMPGGQDKIKKIDQWFKDVTELLEDYDQNNKQGKSS